MARYIDADKFKADILKKYAWSWDVPCSTEDRIIQRVVTDLRVLIEQSITADVAPKSEVARKICCEIEEEIVAALERNYLDLKEWDDGRCNYYVLEIVNRIKGKIDALRGIECFVEELKKKYTGEQT